MISIYAPDSVFEFIVVSIAIVAAVRTALGYATWQFALALALMQVISFVFSGNPLIPVFFAVVSSGLLLRARSGRWVTADPDTLLRQFSLIVAAYTFYTLTRVLVEGGFPEAHVHSSRIIDFESSLGLFIEPGVQRAVLGHHQLLVLLAEAYSKLFPAVVASSLFWLCCTDQRSFAVLRDSLAIAACLTLVIVASFPVAPPRLVPESGLVNTPVLLGQALDFANEYAAVPSNHVGWMAICGFMVGRSVLGRWGCALAVATGGFMWFVVMATGHHYWFDGAIGVAISMTSALLLISRSPSSRAPVPHMANMD